MSFSFDLEKTLLIIITLLISIAETGDIITLEIIPKIIKIRVLSINPILSPTTQTVVPGSVVTPVFQHHSQTSLKLTIWGRLLLLEKFTSHTPLLNYVLPLPTRKSKEKLYQKSYFISIQHQFDSTALKESFTGCETAVLASGIG